MTGRKNTQSITTLFVILICSSFSIVSGTLRIKQCPLRDEQKYSMVKRSDIHIIVILYLVILLELLFHFLAIDPCSPLICDTGYLIDSWKIKHNVCISSRKSVIAARKEHSWKKARSDVIPTHERCKIVFRVTLC